MNHKIDTFPYKNDVHDEDCEEKFKYRSKTKEHWSKYTRRLLRIKEIDGYYD